MLHTLLFQSQKITQWFWYKRQMELIFTRGEIEGTETKEEAIHREVLEELGISVEIYRYLGKLMNIFIRTIAKLPIIILAILCSEYLAAT